MSANRANIDWHLNYMLGAPAANAVPQVWSKHSETGITQASGTTVPPDATAGYAPGCIFIHTDGAVGSFLYENQGTVTSSAFIALESVASIQKGYQASAAGATGPSPLLWDDAPLFEVMLDPSKGIHWFEDFNGQFDPTSTHPWTITQVTSGQILVGSDVGGNMIVDSNGNASAHDGANIQLLNGLVKPAAGVNIWMEMRVNMINTGIDQYFMGLAEAASTALIAGGALEDTKDKVGFFRDDGSTADKISTTNANGSTNTDDDDVATIADNTYATFGFKITGVTKIEYYVNGVLVGTDATGSTTIPNVAICPTFVSQNSSGATDSELHIDWIRLLQYSATAGGGRS